ncbi:hypothetical protein BAX55_18685 [Acinetobacter baumannii]|uniref:hypothetical protein n=1 Tax=Acinetobacter baumannii TaxID=470 RepID=UPI0007EE4824|nr:hypothetical protein [Acinetobacter baumannii]OBS04261.1 hypothetical protein BAX55_18685 [Acinetobacter baumannii]
MAYQCKTIDNTTNQCLAWVEGFSWSDLAITPTQASQIIIAIAGYYFLMWLLKKLRRTVQ